MVITPEDVAQWRNNPVTKKYKELLAEDKQTIMESWASGAYNDKVEPVMKGRAIAIESNIMLVDEIGQRLEVSE